MRLTLEHLHLAIAALFLLVSAPGAHAAGTTANVGIRDGWFRALPPSVPSGGYFTLRNGSGAAVTLTGVESPGCGSMMMHKSGPGGMEHISELTVPAGGTQAFAPGGYHLMCMASRLAPGTSVPVTLIFKDGGKVTVPFQVRSATGK
ncbi:MAG TPA: copper chaperone PCu(A)C [Rhizomicrobium sp.]|jgi:copper(I)-binding protein|nr:copper chaperone PCu(A)C [Rhizomicrobium sp.]